MCEFCFYSKPTAGVKDLFVQLFFGDFFYFFVSQWGGGFLFVCFGVLEVISAQEICLATNCHVVFDKTTVCNICLLLLRDL